MEKRKALFGKKKLLLKKLILGISSFMEES